MKTITVKLQITDEQKAAMEAFAAEHYRPELGIDWKTVAAGWAQGAFDAYLTDHMEAERATPQENHG
jgi:hypothetical protein